MQEQLAALREVEENNKVRPKSLYNTKVAPSETKSHASSETFIFGLKVCLKNIKKYLVKYFCPKLSHSVIIIKSPRVLILN